MGLCILGKSVFFAPFFLIHVSQKKHYKYVSLCPFTRCSFPGQISQMHGPHHQESNTDSAPAQQCRQNCFTIKGTQKPFVHTLKEQNKAPSKDKS